MNIQKEKNRMKTSLSAFAVNAVLFISKMTIGFISGSVSLIADATNNFSDFLTTLVMIIGFKYSSKPADEEHPYGHERVELIGGLLISLFLVYAVIDIVKKAFESLQDPTLEVLNKYVWIVTIVSLILKAFLMYLYGKNAKNDNSELLKAGFIDSRNDVFVACGLLAGYAVQSLFGIKIDGYMGLIIGAMIAFGAYDLIRTTVDSIIGKRPSQEVIDGVVACLDTNKEIIGYHDLMLHFYGNRNQFGSVHIEIDGSMSLLKAHDIADQIEKEIEELLNLVIVVHLDPIDLDNVTLNHVRLFVSRRIKAMEEIVSYHDFRINGSVISFDVVVVEMCPLTDKEIISKIENELKILPYTLEVEIDRNYLLQ